MVKQGYKQTEVGVIPIDWLVKTIGALGYVTSGESPSRFAFDNGNIPYFKVDQLNNSTKYQERTPYKIKYEHPVEKGSIIFPKRGAAIATNKVRILKDPSFFDTNIMSITFTSKLAHSEFFYYYLVRKELWQIADTTSVPQINNKHILPLLCPFPSLVEQERIAEALSDVDDMISSLEKLIAKKKAVKQGAMQELLTGKKRLPKFTGNWEDYTIGKMGEFYSGLSGKSKKDFECGEAYYITFLNVLSNVKIDTSILASVDVRENESQNSVRKGDLFFNTSSETPEEVGMCAVLDEELENTYLNSFCFGFRLFDNTHDPLFLSYYLNSAIGRKIMSVLAQGATRYNLSKNNFAETVIKLPAKDEQTAIASIFSDMDNEIEALEQKLDKTRQIKQGMMQQLLTGKIRLV